MEDLIMLDKSKLVLNQDEKIKLVKRREKGHLGQTEIFTYEVINTDGNVIGTIEETEHTNVNGLNSYSIVIQKNEKGEVIFEERSTF